MTSIFIHLLGYWISSAITTVGTPLLWLLLVPFTPFFGLLMWFLSARLAGRHSSLLPQFLRASAGADELFVRELQNTEAANLQKDDPG